MTQDKVLAQIPTVMTALTAGIPDLEATNRGAELYEAPQLSFLARIRPKEPEVSRIIGDLLNPRGTHGQGPLFLNALLGSLERTRVGRQDPVSVVVEASTEANRRIDILVTTSFDVVGIENKRGARESANQLNDYCRHILSEATKSDRHGTLVLLSDIPPETDDGVVHVTYRSSQGALSLEGLLDACMVDIKAERTRAYVGELIRFIREEDGVANERDNVFADAVLDLPLSQMKAVAATVLAGGRLHRRAIGDIETYIKSRLRESGLPFVFDNSLFDGINTKNSGWIIRRAGWMEKKQSYVAVQSARDGGFGIIYGVVGLKEGSSKANSGGPICPDYDVIQSASSVVPGGRMNDWWPWYASANTGDRGSDWSVQGVMSLILNCPGKFPDDVPGLNRIADDIVALAKAISPILTRS